MWVLKQGRPECAAEGPGENNRTLAPALGHQPAPRSWQTIHPDANTTPATTTVRFRKGAPKPGQFFEHRSADHAAGPQGREGLKDILRTIDNDLGPVTVEQHHLIGEGDLVVQHLTLHGTHRGSTMPLLASTAVSGRPAAWTFIHIWRVAGGIIVEHWACRDDMGLVEQLRG